VISGVQIVPLRVIADDRGEVLHMLRRDSPLFAGFGEIYFSSIRCGLVKGWKRHHRMILNLAVPVGRVRFVLFDEREDSASRGQIQEIVAGHDDYKLIVIPPGIWTAFQGLATGFSLLANCASIPHEQGEAENRTLADPPVEVAW
jgi:dTDP-4-dehydrorhamnose 3,5-epimerase